MVAYVDVVDLKVVNDTRGHLAGDALLKLVVASIRLHLRPYDLVIRVGGDEFLCVMSDVTLEAARLRFDAIATTIEQAPEPGKIRVGFAPLRDAGESAEELIAEADAEVIRTRASRENLSGRSEVSG